MTGWARTVTLLAAVLLVSGPSESLAKTDIHLWHAMGGQLGETVNELVKQFNQSQVEYEVKPLNKGTYAEVLTGAIAAYRQKNPPHIVQVFDVGTQTMLLSGAIHPIFQLLKEQEIKVDWADFIKPVTGYYSKDGKGLYSMPFNSSSPILCYYNKDAFKKAKLADKPPAAWKEVGEISKKIIAAGGVKCGFTPTANSQGHRLGNFVQIRDAIESELENIFAGKKTAREGLDAAVAKGNDILKEFAAANKP